MILFFFSLSFAFSSWAESLNRLESTSTKLKDSLKQLEEHFLVTEQENIPVLLIENELLDVHETILSLQEKLSSTKEYRKLSDYE